MEEERKKDFYEEFKKWDIDEDKLKWLMSD